MDKEELINLLRDNLEIRTELRTSSEYIGPLGDNSGSLYKDVHTLTIRLVFENEVISETSEYLS